MKYPKSEQYDKQFLLENMMGPNALKILEELTEGIKLTSDMKILDLGCGKGLTSIFLAKEFGVQVYATDLWITAAENFERFKKLGLEDRIIPIHSNALDLPYAENYFDAVISVDSYHYFGNTPEFMDTKLAPYIKPNGIIALAFPASKKIITILCRPNCSFPGVLKILIPFTAVSGGTNCFHNLKRSISKASQS